MGSVRIPIIAGEENGSNKCNYGTFTYTYNSKGQPNPVTISHNLGRIPSRVFIVPCLSGSYMPNSPYTLNIGMLLGDISKKIMFDAEYDSFYSYGKVGWTEYPAQGQITVTDSQININSALVSGTIGIGPPISNIVYYWFAM